MITNAAKLVLGTVQFGLPYGINNAKGQPCETEALEIMEAAWAAGINTLDTAEAYGNAHQIIGSFHKNNRDSAFKIMTKLPHEISFDQIEGKVLAYIEELGVDTLDVLMFHSADGYVRHRKLYQNSGILNERRIVKAIGVSVYTNDQLALLIDDPWINVIQLPYNVLDNDSKRGALIAKAKREGKVIHTRSAFLQGLIFMERDSDHKAVRALTPYLRKIDSIAARSGFSLGAIALQYCCSNSLVDRVLIGVESVDQLRANLSLLSKELPQEIIDDINAINVNDETWLNPTNWK